jgi:hypothetical protein
MNYFIFIGVLSFCTFFLYFLLQHLNIIKMSENAGMIGKLVLLVGSVAAMIGRCASAGDDIVRIGARGLDEVAMYGDDAFRSGDDLVRHGDNMALLSKNNISDETAAAFDDVFLEISEQGADFLLEEEDNSEVHVPTNLKEKSLLHNFPLDSIETLFFGAYKAKRYDFNDATRKGFLELLAQSQPREKPDMLDGKSILLRGNGPLYFELLIGADWLGIGKLSNYQYYKYYTLHPSYAKVFLGKAFENETK